MRIISANTESTTEGLEQGPFEPIAIIGLACLLPDSPGIDIFWDNVLKARVSISEVPSDRWKPQDFYDPNGSPGSVAENKTYSKIGGFVRDFEFDWRRWRIPPGSLPQIDVTQLWAVAVSASALEHAGYGEGGKELNRASTGVVFANAVGGENRDTGTLHVHVDQAIRIAKEGGMTDVESFRKKWTEGLPKLDEDTMPGELANVIAGRVANLLDLQGPNYTTDAACASSMAALVDSCRQLQSRQVDVVVCGASDRSMNPSTYAKFSAIGALSATHSTPFDSGADGFVMGEGAGAFILKRLGEAIADGDVVYGVIRGVGASSDGRGKGIAAPSRRGQRQAVIRAYAQAGYESSSVELIEAHGTSTRVGDATELATLADVFSDVPAGDNVAVGSIKSQIGHLKAAAGIAGMLKSILALHHRTIPPSAGFVNPNDTVDWSKNPFFVPTEPREWPLPKSGAPRRAGVSAFGFGGTNFHVALEAYDPEFHLALATRWESSYAAAMAALGSSRGAAKASSAGSEPSDAVSTGHSTAAGSSVASILDVSASPSMTHEELKSIEGSLLLLNAADIGALADKLQQLSEILSGSGTNFDDDPKGRRLSVELPRASKGYSATGVRMALVATSWAELDKRVALALQTMSDPKKWGFLAAQGVMISTDPTLPEEAKIAHLYPGQGSQYVGMTLDLSKRWSAVGRVWKMSDETMVEVLEGESLSSFVLRENLSDDEQKVAEHKLKQTEYTQPAMLTADLAIEGALSSHGYKPDMVAGHSLGEYAALMSSGILAMDGALRAAAARGTEMGAVVIDDTGLMASVTAPYERVAEIIESVDGYVIAANKNSPKMTVIAGETEPVKQAISKFEAAGFTSVILQTSHAFHSRIVAPANEPLKKFLSGLDINWPQIPITSNVDGDWYPSSANGGDAKEAILGKLAPQMASAVEWTKQIETMYEGGARIFVEVGPKRALTVFAGQILEDKPHLAVMSNHPKQGGIASLLQAMGMLALAGRPPQWPENDSPELVEGFRAGPIEAHKSGAIVSSLEWEDLRTRSRPLPSVGTTIQSGASIVGDAVSPAISSEGDRRNIERWVAGELSAICGYPARFCVGQVGLRNGLGLSDAQISILVANIAGSVTTDSAVDITSAVTAADISRWVTTAPHDALATTITTPTPSSGASPATTTSTFSSGGQTGPRSVASATTSRHNNPYVVTGISLGLPGGERVFDDDNFEKLVRGETCISKVSDEFKQRILDKNIVRLIKGSEGQARMETATKFDDIPQLAGQMAGFDLTEEFGIDAKVVKAWDISTQLAVASGLLALRDAAIPLTPVEKVGKGGLRLITNWQIPSVYRDTTGVVFASCFPGIAKMAEKVKSDGDDGEGRFDRSFLFQVLNMGHSQFAQMTGIRGPNTTINLACASTAAAFTIAEDWLDCGRVDRVVIISADNATGEDMWEWIGSGFAASGAASTSDVVEEAALPFDARRNGMILGMGAASFVIERRRDAAERGVQPYAELLGATLANSSFHGTRLDVEHVSASVNNFVGQMEAKWGFDRNSIAPHTFFMSHETYTPARGGSAQAEVKALRDTFGESTNSLVITNTKGFTGHPMGVGIEDAVLIYALATGRAPPVANHREVDPELGDLNISKGGYFAGMEYGLRFAAGFGSQLAVTMWKRCAIEGERINGQRLMAWNRNLAGRDDLELRILDNKLVAYVGSEDNLHGGLQGEVFSVTSNLAKPEPTPEPTETDVSDSEPAPQTLTSPTAPAAPVAPESAQESAAVEQSPPVHSGDTSEIESLVVEVVVEHTGYPADFIELEQDLEGELGIDTVKQAEIMGDIREKFSLPVDEDFVLSEHPTLNHMIAYIVKMSVGKEPISAPVTTAPTESIPHTPEPELEILSSESEVITTPELSVSTVDADVSEATVISEISTQVSDSGDVADIVLDVVVEHTGYPKDFLELDQDLEGELGIDTVKQAEIMGDIRAKFTLPLDEGFSLAEHPTLNHFIAYINRFQQESTPSPTTPIPSAASETSPPTPSSVTESAVEPAVELPVSPEVAPVEPPGVDSSSAMDEPPPTQDTTITEPGTGLRRWQVEVEECEGIVEELDLRGRLVVVTEDCWGLAELVCSELERHGAGAVRLSLELLHKKFTEENDGGRRILRADPSSPGQIAEAAQAILNSGDFGGMIHLAPTHLAGHEWTTGDADTTGAVAMQGLFGLLKHFDSAYSQGDGILASLTALDGRHGNKGERFNSLAAGASGVVKAYAHERGNIRCRAYDVHPEMLLEESELATRLVDDLLGRGGEVEIGLDIDGRRWALVLFDEALEKPRSGLADDEVWLVSGGGSGVTASCIIGLCQASAKSEAHFVLLGRTELLEEPGDWLAWSDEQLEQRKSALREELVASAEDGKVSIVEWNNAWSPYLRSRDIHATIAAINATGNSAEYYSCDVTDAETLTAIGEEIGSSKGQITAIVHGAGIEDSKLVADKEWDVFANVVRVKVDGWSALMAAAEASGSVNLRSACAFTSVAGRFGNGGQSDYAASNNVLDAEMARLSAGGETRAVAIAWTGWRDVGMAARGSIAAIFAAAGIETLPVDVGVRIFVDEMLCGGKRRVVACGALGQMDIFDSFRAPPLRLPGDVSAALDNPERFPFVDRLLAFEQGKSLTGESTLSVEEMPFLADHTIDGVPYHPGVMALEMFAEHSLILCPEHALAGFEAVEFGLPIKLMKGEMKVRTVVEVKRSEGDLIWLEAHIESDLVNSKGQVLGQPRIHHKAEVRLVHKDDDLTGHFVSELAASPRLGVPMAGELELPASFIYERYFHGPRFQSHGGVLRGVGDATSPGCDGIALMRHQLPASDQWLVESQGGSVLLEALPMLIEAGFQNAGLVAMESDGISSLPIGIGWSSMLRVPDRGENLRLRSILTGREEGGITIHDVCVFGDDDAPVLTLKDLRLKAMGMVPEEQKFTLPR